MKSLTIVLIGFLMMTTYTLSAQSNNPWVIPEEYTIMENPVAPDKTSLKEGKKLYKQYCKSCHGAKGEGDGEMAKQLRENPSDFTLDDIDVQTDGNLFYIIKTGRDEMHSFDNSVQDKKIWSIINYIRTLYKG